LLPERYSQARASHSAKNLNKSLGHPLSKGKKYLKKQTVAFFTNSEKAQPLAAVVKKGSSAGKLLIILCSTVLRKGFGSLTLD